MAQPSMFETGPLSDVEPPQMTKSDPSETSSCKKTPTGPKTVLEPLEEEVEKRVALRALADEEIDPVIGAPLGVESPGPPTRSD